MHRTETAMKPEKNRGKDNHCSMILMEHLRKRSYGCRNRKFIYPQFFPPTELLYNIIFAYINFGIHVWCFAAPSCLWRACNTILGFSMHEWRLHHINEIINISMKNLITIYIFRELPAIDTCIKYWTCFNCHANLSLSVITLCFLHSEKIIT